MATKDKKEKIDPKLESKGVLLGAHMSEKAIVSSDKAGVYVFKVAKTANKKIISEAVKKTYKVAPLKIRVARIPEKNIFMRGKWGVKGGGKKAYVYLKRGDKIELI